MVAKVSRAILLLSMCNVGEITAYHHMLNFSRRVGRQLEHSDSCAKWCLLQLFEDWRELTAQFWISTYLPARWTSFLGLIVQWVSPSDAFLHNSFEICVLVTVSGTRIKTRKWDLLWNSWTRYERSLWLAYCVTTSMVITQVDHGLSFCQIDLDGTDFAVALEYHLWTLLLSKKSVRRFFLCS